VTRVAAKRHVSDVARAYDAWAPVYDVDQNPLVALDDAVTPTLFGALAGKDALDVGCGTGRNTIKLVDGGARVTGIDASAGMLARGRERVGGRAKLRVHDLAAPLPFDDGSFDVVVCTLVLEHVPSLEASLKAIARVTKVGGVVVVSDIHPAMRATGTQANFTDPTTGDDVLPPSHAHAVVDYIDAARAAGLHVDVVLEHEGTPRLVERTPRARKYLGKPMLLAFRFQR
jgi:ubiquinone/menaquinone biosynthesis C-methylase UbiE